MLELLLLYICAFIILLIGFMVFIFNTDNKKIMLISLFLFCVSIGIFTWGNNVKNEFYKDFNTSTTQIIDNNGIKYFVYKNQIYQLNGDKQFVDINKYEIKCYTLPGRWVYGIYVEDYFNWKIVPKNVE